jgi:hypothetical protein
MTITIDKLLDILQAYSYIRKIQVVRYDKTPFGKLELKIRCQLIKKYHFQIWLHFESTIQNYAYQLFTDHPILRWDNAPHYPDISTAPHHFHDEFGLIKESLLKGEPINDLKDVLSFIENWISE